MTTIQDSDLRGVPLLFEPTRLVETLSPTDVSRIGGSLELVYLRYKPTRRCLALYEYMTSDGPRWLHATAHQQESWSKHAQRHQRVKHYCPEWMTWTLEDYQVSLYPFPADPNLRMGRVFSHVDVRREFLERLFPQTPEWWEGQLSVMAYKPERRCMAKLVVDGNPCAAIKFYAPGDFEIAKQHARQFRSEHPLVVPRVVGRSQRHRVLAMSWMPGSTWQLPQRWTVDHNAEVYRIGEALGRLHLQNGAVPQIDSQDHPSAPRVSTEIQRLCEDVAEYLPSQQHRLQQAAERLIKRWRTDRRDCVLSHGDFYARQVIPQHDAVAMIDFDQVRWDSRYVDLGNFIAHAWYDTLRARQNSFSRSSPLTHEASTASETIGDTAKDYQASCRLSIAALCDGYSQSTGLAVDRQQLLHAVGIGLFRLLPQPFRRNEPQWEAFTANILDAIQNDLGVGDAGIPWMSDATDLERAQRQLNSAIQPTQRAEIGEIINVELRRHKPGRRCLIEYQWSGGPSLTEPLVTAFGKIRARGLDRTAFRIQQTLYAKHRDELARAGVVIAEPIAEVPLWRMWLQKQCAGVLPWETFDGPQGVELARRVARGIAAYHQLPLKLDRTHTVDNEWSILQERLSLLVDDERYRNDVQEILTRCGALVAELENTTRHCIHRDFYPDQLLVDGPRLAFLDLDLSSMGDGQLDVGNFIAHLIEWCLRRGKPAGALQHVCDALTETYCEIISEASPQAITYYVQLSLARHIELSTRLPGRSHTTKPIINYFLP